MKSYLFLAVKEIKAQKVMAVLILTAVILSCSMTTAIGQSLGILQTMRVKQASSLNGDRYATFHQLKEEQRRQLEADDRLYDVGSLINVGNTKFAGSSLTLFMREYLGNALDAYPIIGRVKEGRLPVSPMEIALPENILPYLDQEVGIGDTITLQSDVSLMDGSIPAYSYTADYTVCGILEADYIGYSTGTVEAVVGEGTAKMLLPEEFLLYSTDCKTKDTLHFQAIIDDLANRLGVRERYVQYNWILLDALGISYREAGSSNTDTGFSFMAFAGVMIGVLVLIAAGLVIYNILKIAVTRRIKEYGTLRAIGGEKGQIYRIVTLQLIALCGVGIPFGLLFGALSAKGILTAATGVLNPDLFMADSAGELAQTIRATSSDSFLPYLVSIAVTLLFAMAAAFPAARYASRVSPTVAMSGQAVKIKRRSRKAKAIHNFEAYYARLNLKRGRGRTVITILSLIMSITVFVALQSCVTLLDTSKEVQDSHLGDYAITDENLGIAPESIDRLRAQEQVADLATTKLAVYSHDENGDIPVELDFALQTWEAFGVAGLNDERLTAAAEGLTEEDKAELLAGTACIVKNPIAISYGGQTYEGTQLKQNDTITVNGKKIRVAGIADSAVSINNEGWINGVQIWVSDELYDALTGSDRYAEVYPTLKQDADREQFETWLEDWCKENAGSHWLSYQMTAKQLEESFEQIKLLCYGLIFFIGLIGILNIINTVYSNIHTRVAEIGMQRAIGMSAGSLYRTFLWEGAYYGIIASVIGGVLGYLCTIVVDAAATDSLQLIAIPWLPILEAAVISILACLLATAVPLRAIAGMNIVESIEGVE